jgi:hypothetical protein
MCIKCASPSGMSGSPMLVPCKSGIFGIHSSKDIDGQGKAVLITKERYRVILHHVSTTTLETKIFEEACARVVVTTVHFISS